MSTTNHSEIYQQRYETFRHLDRIRWQMLQIAVATGSIALTFGRAGNDKPAWWVLAAVGFMFVLFGIVMERIRSGIEKNGIVLKQAGAALGDTDIPDPAHWKTNVSFWIAFFLVLFGGLCFAFSGYQLITHSEDARAQSLHQLPPCERPGLQGAPHPDGR